VDVVHVDKPTVHVDFSSVEGRMREYRARLNAPLGPEPETPAERPTIRASATADPFAGCHDLVDECSVAKGGDCVVVPSRPRPFHEPVAANL